MNEEAAQREARANEMCLNCGSSRWKHHTFAGVGTLCPGNRGAARFPDKKPSPDLVTVPRAELEAIRDVLDVLARKEIPTKPQGNAGAYSILHKQIEAARSAKTKLEAHLKGQP